MNLIIVPNVYLNQLIHVWREYAKMIFEVLIWKFLPLHAQKMSPHRQLMEVKLDSNGMFPNEGR